MLHYHNRHGTDLRFYKLLKTRTQVTKRHDIFVSGRENSKCFYGKETIIVNINWNKVAKIAGYVLPAIGALVGGWANTQDNKKTTIETTEKLFEEYVKNK